MAKQAKWGCVQGDTLTGRFRLINGDTRAAAVATDLTGCAILIQVRPNVADVDGTTPALIELSTADGTIETPGSDGWITPNFNDKTAATGTGNPALDDAIWDVQVTFPDGTVKTYPPKGFPRGLFEFAKDVSRAS